MINVLLWLVVIVGYGIAIYCVIRTYVFAFSLFRDAPFVPVDSRAEKRALELLELKEGDKLVDIGSGNGTVVFSASKELKGKGEFVGVEMDKWLVKGCNIRKSITKNSKSITFIQGDAFKQDYSRFNKVFIYMTTNLTSELVKTLDKQLKKGSIVVSVMFSMGDKFIKKHNVAVKSDKIGRKTWKYYIWKK